MVLSSLPGLPDPTTETSCRHCGQLIRKRRSAKGDEQEWVSFVGLRYYDGDGGGSYNDPSWYSRFCPREVAEAKGGRRIQHAPIPIGNVRALERWLNS